MDYQNYGVVDFVLNEDFFDWVIKPNESLDKLWEGWLERHPHKREEAEEARWYILHTRELLKSSRAVSDQRILHLMKRIRKTLEE